MNSRVRTWHFQDPERVVSLSWVLYLPHFRVGRGDQHVRDGAVKALVCPWSSGGQIGCLLWPVSLCGTGLGQEPSAAPCLWALASDWSGGPDLGSSFSDT